MKIAIKNWDEFQHYKDRRPPWIKLHKGLLDDFQFWQLQVASRALAPCIWLYASEFDGGVIECELAQLAFRFRMTEKEVSKCLEDLEKHGFIAVDSEVLAEGKQGASPRALAREEKRREREERERLFAEFWKVWPKKSARVDAEKAWEKLEPDEALTKKIIAAVEVQKKSHDWTKDGGKYIPLPATYLNGRRFEDEPPKEEPKARDIRLLVRKTVERTEQGAIPTTGEPDIDAILRRFAPRLMDMGPATRDALLDQVQAHYEGRA